MAAISLTPALEKLCERVQAAGSDFDVMTVEQRQMLATEVGAGHVSNQSLRLLQQSLVYFGEEGTLRTYLEGSKVIMPGLVIKHDKVHRRRILMACDSFLMYEFISVFISLCSLMIIGRTYTTTT